jgi:7,8-dihydropterin-6-yl-methyl-4-(beta-D-ribofuranosyl)aminobenzene 5'-phosphate synthase
VAAPPLPLLAVDRAEISIVMDNTVDMLMADAGVAQRVMPRFGPNPFERPWPIAEHGFSVLITVETGGRRSSVLFDTGVSPSGILHNMDALEIRAGDIQAIVLSHGHADHAMGMNGLLDRLGPRRLPLVLHPDAYLERKLIFPNGRELNVPPPKRSDLRRENVELIEEVGPSLLVGNAILVSGEVARTTEFEKGFPIHYARRDGAWVPDPLIPDDQCAIVHLRGKGLVVVTGCGHAGIINIIRNAQAITGVPSIHAVIGGFHLTGGQFESIIAPTVAALQAIGPRYVVPGHCTGWSATHQIARAMPEAFIQNSVGTNFVLT